MARKPKRRPKDSVQAAVQIGKIATGEIPGEKKTIVLTVAAEDAGSSGVEPQR